MRFLVTIASVLHTEAFSYALARSPRPTNGPFLATILYLKSDWLLFKRAVFANTPLVLQRMNQS